MKRLRKKLARVRKIWLSKTNTMLTYIPVYIHHARAFNANACIRISARDVFVSIMALLSVYLYFLAYEEGEHPGATVYTHKEGNKIKKDYKTG